MSQRTTIIVVLLVSIVRAQDLRKNCADIEGDETNVPFDCAANVPLGLDWTLKDQLLASPVATNALTARAAINQCVVRKMVPVKTLEVESASVALRCALHKAGCTA